MSPKTPPNLFRYLDYRVFLSDFIAYKKQTHSKYSYRYFSNRSEFASTNFISLVVKGKRNLTSSSIGKITKGLKLNKQQRAFFEDLVFMNQAETHEEKDYYYQRMMRSKPFLKIRKLSKSNYDYFSKWYYPVIRELVSMVPQPMDADRIGSLITPPITTTQVESAVKQLLRLGLIQEDEETGRLKKADAALTTGAEVRSLEVANFHKEILKLANQSIDRFSEKERDISSVILSIPSSKMDRVKEKIDRFRKELIEFAQTEEGSDQVVVVQIGGFPLSKPTRER